MTTTDRIEKDIIIRAPQAHVWRALTDFREFGKWFRAELEQPFVPGQRVTGRTTYPGYEHIRFDVTVDRMEPETYFSYRWHPCCSDAKVDVSAEKQTFVEFHLEAVPGGTRLRVVESGFDALPPSRRSEAFRMNSNGWVEQLGNVTRHAESTSSTDATAGVRR